MQGMFPYPVFSSRTRKYRGETLKDPGWHRGPYPKNKSNFQNLKFRKVLRVHIYVRSLGFFEQIQAKTII